MPERRASVLQFADPAILETGVVGRVHADGSITFRGTTYPNIKELPAECQALRPDVEAWAQWRRLYRAIAPRKALTP